MRSRRRVLVCGRRREGQERLAGDCMQMLIAAAAVFLAIHLFVAGTRLREAVTGVIGERPYLGLFSLASLGIIVWLAIAYKTAQTLADDRMLYDLGRGVHDMGIPIVAL